MMKQRVACLTVVMLTAVISMGCVSSAIERELAAEYYNLGNAYYHIRSYEKAIEYFSHSIAQDPELLTAHYNLSLALIKSGRGPEADIVLNKLLETEPENVAVLQILGYSYYTQQRFDEALAVFDEILVISPGHTDARYNRGIIVWDQEKKPEAIAVFEELLEQLPGGENELYLQTLFNLGQLYVESGDSQRVIEHLERFLEWKEDDTEAFLILARAYKRLEHYSRALAAYERILILDENLAEAWFDKAEILLTKIEDPIQGAEALARSLSLGFNDAERIESLLNEPGLTDREAAEEILESWGRLPEVEE